MPDSIYYDPDHDEFELFLKMVVTGIAKPRPALSADLVVTDSAREQEQNREFQKEEQRLDRETAQAVKEARDREHSITVTHKDHYGRERQQIINLTKQPVLVIGQFSLFPDTYKIGKDDLDKLTAHAQQQVKQSSKAQISVERDLDTSEIKSFTIEDKFARVDSFDDKSSPSDYSKLLLRAGTGFVSYELSPELQQTARQWQEKWEREHIILETRDDQEPDKVWRTAVDVTELDVQDLQNYKHFAKEYHLDKRDIAKVDTRLKELDKSFVLPKQDLEVPPATPQEKAQIEVNRDEETGEIKYFTVYDKLNNKHVFDEKTRPEEYRDLEDYGDVKIELDDELQEVLKNWHNQYERSHITIHSRDFVYETDWCCVIDLTDEGVDDLNHYKRLQEDYYIEPRDMAKIDKWFEEHKLELTLDQKLQLQEKQTDRDNIISYTPEATEELPKPYAQELDINKLSTPELNHLAQLDYKFNISLDDTYKMTKLLDERYEQEHINIKAPIVENKAPILIPRELDLNDLTSTQLHFLQDNDRKYQISDVDKEKLGSYIQTRDEHNQRYNENAEVKIERDEQTGQINSFEIRARLQDGHGFKETREFDRDTIPEVWKNLLDTKQEYGNVKIELTPELELVAKYWQEKFEQEHVRFNMPAASGDDKSYYLNLEETKMSTLQFIKDHADEYSISPKDEIKLDYQMGLKQLHEQEVRLQPDKIIDIENKLNSHITPDLDQQQIDHSLAKEPGHDLADIKPEQERAFIYQAQQLTSKEVEQEYGLDELARTLSDMAHSSPDYQREPNLQIQHEPDKQVPVSGSAQPSNDSASSPTEIQQDVQFNQDYDQELDR